MKNQLLPRFLIAAGISCVVLLSIRPVSAATWIGTTNLLWGTTTNWSPAGVPSNAANNVFEDGSSAYQGSTTPVIDLGGVTRTVGSIGMLSAGSAPKIASLTFSNGTIALNATGGSIWGSTLPVSAIIASDATLSLGGFNATFSMISGTSLQIDGHVTGSGAFRPTGTGGVNTVIFNSNNSGFSGSFTLDSGNPTSNLFIVNATGALGTNTAASAISVTSASKAANEFRIGTAGVTMSTNASVAYTTASVGASYTYSYSAGSGVGTFSGNLTEGGGTGGTATTAAATLNATAAGGTLDYTGLIANANNTTSPMAGLYIEGAGVVKLSTSAGNTYGSTASNGSFDGTNSTIVRNSGSLLLMNTSGSATGGNGVLVQSTGTLGGIGQITTANNRGVTISSGGFLSAGDSTAVDTTGNLTMSLGTGSLSIAGTNSWEINQLSTSSGFDKVTLSTGSLVLQTGSAFNISILGAANDPSNVFWQSNHSWQVFSTSALATGTFSSLTGSTSFDGGAFSLNYANNGVFLNFTAAVPEPSIVTGFMIGMALLGLAARRRLALF